MNRNARLQLALLAAMLLVPFHDAVPQARAGANSRAAFGGGRRPWIFVGSGGTGGVAGPCAEPVDAIAS